MASSTSNRVYQANNGNLSTPKQQRRMTSPASSTSLNLPNNGRNPSPRPHSPLRQGFVLDSGTGIDPDVDDDSDGGEDPAHWQRSPSPASSVSNLAASFVQRVNTFVGGINTKSASLLSDAELEAEAERERDRSRREAEAILTREAQQRKLVGDRVLAAVESAKSLPPPPSRSQTTLDPPSPASSTKEPSWWTAAKNRLTPTKDKEPLTPAQQVIQDAKSRGKDKKNAKGKEKVSEWPAVPSSRTSDPPLANLSIPVAPPTRKPVPSSPVSPTPSRPSLTNMPPNLTPSPMRATESLSSSPSREAPPLYAQFNNQGTLDIAGTLLTIAKRFEKLEKWTVGHVRALEDRMNDVERWLVDKEKEKDEKSSTKNDGEQSPSTVVQEGLQEIREEISELQGRVGQLGREMARMATAPSNLSSGPKAQTAIISAAPPTTSSILVQNNTGSSIPSTPHSRLSSASVVESTSPPMTSNRTPSRTRLPYPKGDYTSPSDAFSPPNSPPGSLSNATRNQPLSIPGLPSQQASIAGSYSSVSSASSYGNLIASPITPLRTISPSPSGQGLDAPSSSAAPRQGSISPTPRKRYTVALGGPISAPDELSSNGYEPPRRVGTPKMMKGSSFVDDDNDNDDGFNEETIGKSSSARLSSLLGDSKSAANDSPSSNRRIRAQSAYGLSSIPGASSTTNFGSGIPSVAPLKPKLRSKSTERLSSNTSISSGSGNGFINSPSVLGSGKFVDPLVLRKQSRDNMKPIAMPKPVGKVPIGQLVAFFDKDKNKS